MIYGINYAPEIAGVGKYSGEIGEFLVARGHEVCVVSTPPHYPGWRALGGYSNKVWSREIVDGATVYRCPLYLHPDMKGIRRILAPLTFALSSGPVAITQILRRRPDVVLVVEPTFFAAPAALIAAKLVGAKTVLHVQDLEIDAAFAVGHIGKGGFAAKLAKAFEETTLRFFDQVITISSRMAEKIAEKGVSPSRIDVIRNWVDVERIRPEIGASPYRAELALADDIKVALYSGNIGAKQGLRLIIEAAEQLADRPDILFVIAGDGPMRGAVAAAADRLPNIRLLPFQPEARFSDFLNLADIHLLPQEREAADLLLPSKLGGMLASGKPILVTADPGTELSDFLGASCELTPPGDSARVAEALRRMADAAPDAGARAERLARAQTLSKRTVIYAFETALLSPRLGPTQPSPKS
nr:WcaI family glycosyltransferase [Phenylobacterium glaciei]